MLQTAASTTNFISHAGYAAYGNLGTTLPPSARIDDMPAHDGDGAAVVVCTREMLGHRDYLVRFAARKLHDPALAEDVVHDVFEAVIAGNAVFHGRAALRSWLTAILKNKIIDVIRHRARFDSFDVDADDETGEANAVASLSPGPYEIAEQRELLGQVLQRIASLPAGLRDVMQFRVLHDESSEVVCKRLAISEASLFVRLHRARKQLVC